MSKDVFKSRKKFWGLNSIYNQETHTLTFTSGTLTWNHSKKHPVFLGIEYYVAPGEDYPDDPVSAMDSVIPDSVEMSGDGGYFEADCIKHVVFKPAVNISHLKDSYKMFDDMSATTLVTSTKFAKHLESLDSKLNKLSDSSNIKQNHTFYDCGMDWTLKDK